eukprot:917433-Amphidinium_carterae.7
MQNIDLCSGIDIRDARTPQPCTCTSFSGWSGLNRQNPSSWATWEKSHLNGVTCSKFTALVVELQLQGNRHFLLENPCGSDLFDRPEWKHILATYPIEVVNIEQCALGLKSPLGHPVRKSTTLWASSPMLLDSLRDARCRCQADHRQVQGSEAGYKMSVWAQAWPSTLCRRNVDGLERLINSRVKWSYPVHV